MIEEVCFLVVGLLRITLYSFEFLWGFFRVLLEKLLDKALRVWYTISENEKGNYES